MTGPHKNTVRSISLLVAGTVILCHVMGALCVMVPSSAMAEPVGIVSPPAQTPMAGDHGCWQYVPSSEERLATGHAESLAFSPAIIRPSASPDCRWMLSSVQLRSARVPLQAFLSTFRI